MKLGTRSLLFGVHQFLWHPLTVLWAWVAFYGRWPDWRTLVCILLHDWGYWGKPNMDGQEGQQHPVMGSRIAGRLFGPRYHNLVLYHSRSYARQAGTIPSALCWPDKLSLCYEPMWWYLLRARLSGELKEYRREAAEAGFVPATASDEEWFRTLQAYFRRVAAEQRAAIARRPDPACTQEAV